MAQDSDDSKVVRLYPRSAAPHDAGGLTHTYGIEHAVMIWFARVLHDTFDSVLEEPLPNAWTTSLADVNPPATSL